MISVKLQVFYCLCACKSQNNNSTNLRKKKEAMYKKVYIFESLYLEVAWEQLFYASKPYFQLGNKKFYIPYIPIHTRFYLRICSQYFLIFSCNIQSIAIIIAPAFKIQKHSARFILKKRFPRPMVRLLVIFCHRVYYYAKI